MSGQVSASRSIWCRTLHECVDWNKKDISWLFERQGRTLHECVDWNIVYRKSVNAVRSRTLHECVDWNYRLVQRLIIQFMSHSTRVRGLKYMRSWFTLFPRLSHSTRVRGLKSLFEKMLSTTTSVALYTSAWIEIEFTSRWRTWPGVALYTSAWIEIFGGPWLLHICKVALYTSAWIEI